MGLGGPDPGLTRSRRISLCRVAEITASVLKIFLGSSRGGFGVFLIFACALFSMIFHDCFMFFLCLVHYFYNFP